MEDTIILYPSPGMGHLVPMVELGKLILTHNPSFSITILITTAPFETGSTCSYITGVSATTPSIHFHHFPTISPPSTTSLGNVVELAFELPRLHNSNLHHFLQTMISQKSTPKASIIDLFCNASFEVLTSLGIPTYYFCPSSASSLSAILSLPKTHQIILEITKDPKITSIEFPGVPPTPTLDLPGPLFDTEGIAYKNMFGTAINMTKSGGILTNTCQALEPRAVKAISDGLCTPNLPTPSVYCVGPIIANSGEEDHEHECLRWLDSQPSRSVVFLCFGSMGLFKAEQLMEMAIGLEKSGHRFLWVVRSPAAEGESKSILAEPVLDVLLPDGFLDRTRGRGLVVKKWAPQVAVLSHNSVGGFVTHCGWNSILEAVSAGVPMVGWPLYAEQRYNRVLLVEEMKVALALEESEKGFVFGHELEKRVRELMDSVIGKGVRERVREMRYFAKAARGDGGSSRVALAELVESWKDG